MPSVKWNKRVLAVDLPATSDDFKAMLFSLTGVPSDRQTLMCKQHWKGVLADGVNLAELNIAPDALIVMMGTPTTAVPDAPKDKVVFLEDLTSSTQAAAGKVLPPGLTNLGNTCYLNATVQMLRAAPELVQAVTTTNSSAPVVADPASKQLAKDFGALLVEMSRFVDKVTPIRFVTTVRQAIPRFNEQTPRGGFVQQDADEFYNELMTSLARVVGSAVDDYFGIELEIKSRCVEAADEPETTSRDKMKRLQCTIDASIAYLEAGIKLGLDGVVEKHSEVLGRNAQFTQTKRLCKLPKYLVVQLNRFFWKPTPDSMDHRGVACKILKQVKFPATLDVYEYCSDSVKAVLKVPRDARVAKMFTKKAKPSDAATAPSAMEDVKPADTLVDADEAELQRALAMSMAAEPAHVGVGLPANFDGRYELVGIVSHKGRSSNSGHYMAWVKQNSTKWICFDDEHPSECTWADVENLAGGGDYRAFLLQWIVGVN